MKSKQLYSSCVVILVASWASWAKLAASLAIDINETGGGSVAESTGASTNGSFYCEADKRNIGQVKVCNFLEDCSNGEDELECGACRWTADELATEISLCGLQVFHSSALEAKFGNILVDIEHELAQQHGGKFINWLKFQPSKEVRALAEHGKYVDVSMSHYLAAIQEVLVEFPRLRPTDNAACELSIWLHSSLNLAFAMSQVREPPATNVSANLFEWPRLSVYLIEPQQEAARNGSGQPPANETDWNRIELLAQDVFGRPTMSWFELRVRVGQRLGAFWRPRLRVETKVESNLLAIGPIAYRNCEPKDVANLEQLHPEPANSLEFERQLASTCQGDDKFLCKLSGRCIERRFVCDFGHDCGPLDGSDEEDCSLYEGRCDFEQADQCGWAASQRGAWLWLDARQELSDKQPHPQLDHTYQSTRWAGHFMLLNASQLSEFAMAQMVGPRVQLKPAHSECHFRFWASTGGEPRGEPIALHSPYLAVGYEHIRAGELFQPAGERREENGWRRFELALFHRNISDAQRPLYYALHISFGNLSKELLEFKRNQLYLALDDFSFSPGCQLAYYELETDASICPAHQFKCERAPSATPSTFCVPRNRVCDFKPDCGLDPVSKLASDELACAAECALDDGSSSLADCGLELPDLTQSDGLSEQLNRPIWFNHAFAEAEFVKEKQRGLELRSQFEQFHTNQQVAPRDNTTLKVEIESVILNSALFSQAHANCTLQLDYAFSPNAVGLTLIIELVSAASGRETFYATLFPHSSPQLAAGARQRLELGLGEQRRPFRLRLSLLADTKTSFAGSLTLFRYKFLRCQHAAGRLNPLKSPIILQVGADGLDDDDDDDEDDAQLFDNTSNSNNTTEIDQSLACPPGQFQCQSPILCVPNYLRCDMQVDCQDSALDEFNCNALGAQLYDFEHDSDGSTPAGWQNELAEPAASGLWRVWRHKRFDRIDFNSGPPVDHSHINPLGKFLVLSPRNSPLMGTNKTISPQNSAPTSGQANSIQALIYAPAMSASARCTRAVFYFYYWQGQLRRQPNAIQFKVFITRTLNGRTELSSKLLYELPAGEQAESDRWQRVQLDLAPQVDNSNNNNNNSSMLKSNQSTESSGEQFRLAFIARLNGVQLQSPHVHFDHAGRTNIFALDDVSFSFDCQPVGPAGSAQLLNDLKLASQLNVFEEQLGENVADREEGAAGEQPTRVYIGRPFLMLLVLAFIVVVAATFINHRRRAPYGRMRKHEPEQDDGLVLTQL